MPRIHFVSFATPAFRPRQWLLETSARYLGKAEVIHTWNPRRLREDGFLTRHADLFPGSKGYGWYAWKPYIIHQTLIHADDGDLVIYQDVGRREPILITHPLGFWFAFLKETSRECIPGVEIPWWGPNKLWTKRLAFERLGLDNPEVLDEPQVQASWSVWLRCPSNLAFTREWAELCTHRELVGSELPEGHEAEYLGFKEHRWDQSLLTLLVSKHGLPALEDARLPIRGINEKSVDVWMQRLGASRNQTILALAFGWTARLYVTIEIPAKHLFKRKECLPA